MEDRTDAPASRGGDSAPASEPTKSPADTLKASAKDIAGTVKDAARDTMATVRDGAMSRASDLQASAAEQAKTAAQTLRKSADGLEEELPWMRTALNKTADGLEQITSSLNSGDINQTLSHVSDFAKRQPALFIGLSVAAGFTIARIGKTAMEKGASNASDGATNMYPSTPAA